jgi:hypothetical protein
VSGTLLNDNNLSFGTFTVLFILPLMAVVVTLGWQWTKTKRQQQQILLRQRQALQVAKQQLTRVTFSDTQSSYEQISQIVQRYVADKLNIDLLDSKKLDILPLGISKSVIVNMSTLIQQVDEGLFAPSMQTLELSRRDAIAKLLTHIDDEWMKR